MIRHFTLGMFLILAPNCFGLTISGDIIAQNISNDCGNPKQNYEEYGANLARTLGYLSPEALERVFKTSVRIDSPTLNSALDLGDINFRPGSADLSVAAMQELDKVFEFMMLNDDAKIVIEGHAQFHDGRSQSLSEERAAEAMAYLQALGIDSERLESIGYGADRQIVEGGKNDGTEVNRRIEIRYQE